MIERTLFTEKSITGNRRGTDMGNYELMRQNCCCFTGHRPEKLQWDEQTVVNALESEIYQAITDGFTTFLTGMARGVDIWAGETVLRLRAAGAPIHLICASPYAGFERRWSNNWQHRYNAIMQAADHVEFICPHYSRSCFQIRNVWLVDHSARVIAVYNGQSGGTRNTLQYAKKQGLVSIIICKFKST